MAGLFVRPRAGSGGGERTSPCHTLSNSDFSGHKDGALNATDKEMPVRDREASQDAGQEEGGTFRSGQASGRYQLAKSTLLLWLPKAG